MKNLKNTVVLMRSVRTAKGWSRREVVTGKGRNWEARIDREPKYFGPDVTDFGGYTIRRYENGKTMYEPGGDTYNEAVAVYTARANRVNARRAAAAAGIELPAALADTPSLLLQAESFLATREAKGKHTARSTRKSYRITIEEFIALTGARHVKDVTPETLVAYLAGMRKRGLNPQTIANRYIQTGAVLRFANKELADAIAEYRPAAPQRKKVSYTAEELERLLTFLRERPRYQKLALVAETYFKTGLRNRELAYLTWDVVDLKRGYIRGLDNRELTVLGPSGRAKKVVFRTKARRDRDVAIPLPDGLLARLRAWRETRPSDRFVFPNRLGNPDLTFLKKIRPAICRAGLACGSCDACLSPCGYCQQCRCGKCGRCRRGLRCDHPRLGDKTCIRIQCRKWKIHGFRHSFVTLALQGGADVSTVKDVAGHADLRTTTGYLSAIEEAKARERLNRVFAD